MVLLVGRRGSNKEEETGGNCSRSHSEKEHGNEREAMNSNS